MVDAPKKRSAPVNTGGGQESGRPRPARIGWHPDAGLPASIVARSLALGAIEADTFTQGYDCMVLENQEVVTCRPNGAAPFRRFETLGFRAS